jgi:hypothetical protein
VQHCIGAGTILVYRLGWRHCTRVVTRQRFDHQNSPGTNKLGIPSQTYLVQGIFPTAIGLENCILSYNIGPGLEQIEEKLQTVPKDLPFGGLALRILLYHPPPTHHPSLIGHIPGQF